jgi:hypothetical protein
MSKKISFRKPGRPPAPTSAFGIARPKKHTKVATPQVNLSALPGAGAIGSLPTGAPTAGFRKGGFKPMPSKHDCPGYAKGSR